MWFTVFPVKISQASQTTLFSLFLIPVTNVDSILAAIKMLQVAT